MGCHIDIQGNHSQFAEETDQPVAALLTDLEQRGLLDETLVIWCGEFGRLPIAQTGAKPGRDHNPIAIPHGWLEVEYAAAFPTVNPMKSATKPPLIQFT